MSWLNEITPEEYKNAGEIPDGEYEVIVKNVELKEGNGKQGKYALLNLMTTILSGQYRGQGLFVKIYIGSKPISIGFYKRDVVKILGFEIPVYELESKLSAFNGACFIALKRRQKNDPSYGEVVPVKAIEAREAQEDDVFVEAWQDKQDKSYVTIKEYNADGSVKETSEEVPF